MASDEAMKAAQECCDAHNDPYRDKRLIAEALDAFAVQAVAKEREACVHLCEAFAETAAMFLEKYPEDGHHMAQSAGNTLAATIRRRGGANAGTE